MSIVVELRRDPHYLRRLAAAKVLRDTRYDENGRYGYVRVTEYLYGCDRIKQVMHNGETVRVVKTRIAPRRARI